MNYRENIATERGWIKMLCPYCNSAGCEEDCVDFCYNCDKTIEAGEDFCNKECEIEFENS